MDSAALGQGKVQSTIAVFGTLVPGILSNSARYVPGRLAYFQLTKWR